MFVKDSARKASSAYLEFPGVSIKVTSKSSSSNIVNPALMVLPFSLSFSAVSTMHANFPSGLPNLFAAFSAYETKAGGTRSNFAAK